MASLNPLQIGSQFGLARRPRKSLAPRLNPLQIGSQFGHPQWVHEQLGTEVLIPFRSGLSSDDLGIEKTVVRKGLNPLQIGSQFGPAPTA